MKRFAAAITTLLLVTACSREEATQNTQATADRARAAAGRVADKVTDTFDVSTPSGKDDPATREQERFDEQWRNLESFRAQQARQAQATQAAQAQQQASQQAAAAQTANLKFVANVKESFKGATPEVINAAPIAVPIKGDVLGPSVLKAQVMLDRINFSVAVIDGRWGRNSAIATYWFQQSRGMQPTGLMDEPTFRALAQEAGAVPPLAQYAITAEDVKGPYVKIPDEVYDQEKLDCLCYETLAEKLAETFHTTIDFLKEMNPGIDLATATTGIQIWVPNVSSEPPAQRDIARVVVSIAGNTFNAFDAAGTLVFHSPTTLGSTYDPSPSETLKVVKAVENPHFHYQPKLFADVDDSKPEANLNPGPNSPVGVVWIALSKPHYGIHGTSNPDAIGYASSHGCVRLTNWDALDVSRRIGENVQVEFTDTRKSATSATAEKTAETKKTN